MVLPPEKAVPDTDAMPGQLVTQSELIGNSADQTEGE